MELTAELFDYLETDYFVSALYEAANASFVSDFVEGLTTELQKRTDLFTKP